MKKDILKLIVINIVILILVFSLNIVFANPFSVYDGASVNSTEIKSLGGKVLGIINVAGTVIAICVLLFIGMKFMIASPDEKANLKGALTPYIVGAVLLFASTNIAHLIYEFSDRYVK